MRRRGEEEDEVTEDQPGPAIRRQVDVTDVTGIVRRAWEYTYQGDTYYLREADQERTMLVETTGGWE